VNQEEGRTLRMVFVRNVHSLIAL